MSRAQGLGDSIGVIFGKCDLDLSSLFIYFKMCISKLPVMYQGLS